MTKDQELAAGRLDPEQLKAKADEMVAAVTNPAVMEKIRSVLAAPRDEQYQLASDTLTPQALIDAGADFPMNTRITSRYFEEESMQSVILGSGELIDGVAVEPKFKSKSLAGRDTEGLCVCLGGGACVGVGG